MSRQRLAFSMLLLACGGAPVHVETAHDTPAPAPRFVQARVDGMHGAFVSALDTPVTSFGAAVLGGELYVAGGYFGTPHDYDREGQSAALLRLSSSGAWETRAPIDTGLQGFALVALGDSLVRCGGSRIDNAPGATTDMHSIATCARYVPASDAWETFADLPAPRSSFDAAVLDGAVYAIGGWNIEGDQEHTTFVDTMAVLDATTHTWTSVPCPVTRRALAVVATTHAIVAIGGMSGVMQISGAVDVFDPHTQTWSQGPEFPSDGFGMAATAIGDTVYASGSTGTMYRWTIGEPAWTAARTLVQPRFFHRLVPMGTAAEIWAIGGIGSMTMDGRAALIESIPTSASTAPAFGWTEISFPGRVRNRFGMFAADDSLYVFGGNDSPAQHDFAPTNFVAESFRLHVPSLRWFPLDALPEARQSLESVRVGDSVIALGGFGHDGHAARTFADAFVMREDSGWELVRDALPTGRTQFGSTFWGDAIWIFAGLVFDESPPEEQQFTHLEDVLRCPVLAAELAVGDGSPIGACETIAATLGGTRRAFASAALGDHMFIVGGMREGFASVDDCLDFDFTTRTFAPMACPAHVRISATMLEHGARLYLVGGSARTAEGLTADRSIEAFDPITHTWSTVIEALPFDTHQGRWAFAGERLVMLSTQDAAGAATLAMIDVAQPAATH